MKILVLIKHVPDTESKIKVAADGKSLDEAGLKMVISPFDEYALEEALLLKDASGAEVVLVCAGRDAAQTSLRQGLAMGADRAILIHHDGYDRADALTRAEALAAVAKAESADLIFCGKVGVGGDEGLTGPMVAELLGWGHAGNVSRLSVSGDVVTAYRGIEGAVEIVEGPLPILVTWDKGLHDPRYASLKGIMAAKKKLLDVKTPADVGVKPPDTSRSRLESMELPPPRASGRVLQGEAGDSARELVRLLREEAKVI